MIDGLLLLLELGLMLVLLLTVWRARQKGREDDLGFFAYKPLLEPPRPGRPPRAGGRGPGGAPDA